MLYNDVSIHVPLLSTGLLLQSEDLSYSSQQLTVIFALDFAHILRSQMCDHAFVLTIPLLERHQLISTHRRDCLSILRARFHTVTYQTPATSFLLSILITVDKAMLP